MGVGAVVVLIAIVAGAIFLKGESGRGHSAASRSAPAGGTSSGTPSGSPEATGLGATAPVGPVPSNPTPDGAILKPGQTARLYTGTTVKHWLAVTVTSVERAPAADLASVKMSQPLGGQTPYYIRFTVANLGAADPYFNSDFGLFMQGLLSDSGTPNGLTDGYPKQCSGGNVPYGAWTKGAVFPHFCTVTLAPAPMDSSGVHATVVGAQWWNIYSSDNNNHAVYWKS